jgi:hypothetical protein
MTIDDYVKLIGEWGEKTFTKSTQQSIINHLRDEVSNELCVDCNEDEYADIVMMVMHLCYKRGLSLEKIIRDKFEVNQGRTWGEPNELGYVEHI